MPNWCENMLEVSGSQKEISLFKNYLKQGKNELDFMMILPPPNNEWNYDWCVDNWGTKWEPEDINAGWNPELAVFDFWTAWGPPVGIWAELARKFPNLVFEARYCEGGMDFSGWHLYEKGELVEVGEGAYGEYYGDRWWEDEEEEE